MSYDPMRSEKRRRGEEMSETHTAESTINILTSRFYYVFANPSLQLLIQDSLIGVAAQVPRHGIKRQIQEIINESIKDLAEQFRAALQERLESDHVEAPRRRDETVSYLSDAIHNSTLTAFYSVKSSLVQRVAIAYAAKADEITSKYQLTPKLSRGLIKLALYDFVILCGMSSPHPESHCSTSLPYQRSA